MKKVHQTIVCKGKGNCMQAVLASLFEMDLDQAINVMDHPETAWHVPFMDWIDEATKFTYVGVCNAHSEKVQTLNALQSLYAVHGCFYGVVPSKNFKDVTHAVIIDRNGVVIHDPNPDNKWLGVNTVESGDLIYWYMFEPKDSVPVYEH